MNRSRRERTIFLPAGRIVIKITKSTCTNEDWVDAHAECSMCLLTRSSRSKNTCTRAHACRSLYTGRSSHVYAVPDGCRC